MVESNIEAPKTAICLVTMPEKRFKHILPQMAVKHGDESHGGFRKKSPKKQIQANKTKSNTTITSLLLSAPVTCLTIRVVNACSTSNAGGHDSGCHTGSGSGRLRSPSYPTL